jgi:excisionase family DNA binding protein
MNGQELLTPDELAAEWKCSRKTVLRAIRRGDLEATAVGERGALRIRREWSDAYLERKRVGHARTFDEDPLTRVRGSTVRKPQRGRLDA